MVKLDEDALICDLAETYRIYDYRSLPLRMVATFSVGLRDDSRIKMKLNNMKVSTQTFIIAQCFDVLNLLLWTKTKEAEHGRGRPERIAPKLMINDEKKEDLQRFRTPDEFWMAREQILKGGNIDG